MCLAFYCQFPVCKKVFLYFHEVRGTSALYNFPTYQWSQNNNTMAPVWSLGTVASLYLGVIRLYHRVIFGSIIWARFHKPPFEKSCAIPAARLDQKQWMYLVTTCHNIRFDAVQICNGVLKYLDRKVDCILRCSVLVEKNRYEAVYFSLILIKV